MNRITVAAATLGCKVNQYDTDALISQLAARGYEPVDFETEAAVYIINTCTVTHTSDSKSRQLIRRAHRRNPQAAIVVCGCFAETNPDAVQALEGVTLVAGAKDKARIADMIDALTLSPAPPATSADPTPLADPTTSAKPPVYGQSRTRAYVKIQEGCDRFCAYCIVPYARGPVRSRALQAVLDEATRLADQGCKEIVLTGIHAASYGKDLCGGESLPALIEAVGAVDGLARLRLSSIDPCAVNDAFLAAVSRVPILCDHFHLSLQSGCDRTLARMNRRYTTAQYAQAVARIRAIRPDAAFTTDMIVGFPGESEQDFEESYAFAQAIGFARVHVFLYSPRAGTPAATFDGPVSETVKAARGRRLRALGAAMSRDFYTAHLGRVMPVLFESAVDDAYLEGHTTNYMMVRSRFARGLTQAICAVRLARYADGVLYAEDAPFEQEVDHARDCGNTKNKSIRENGEE